MVATADKPVTVPGTPTLWPASSPNYRRRGIIKRFRADVLDVALTTLVVIPVAIFIGQGGLSTMGTIAGFLRGTGVLAGLVATALLLEMVMLASRIPFVDRTIGHNQALAKHKSITAGAVSLLFVHAVALLLGYAATDRVGVIAESAALWAIDDFMLAVLALGLLCLVGVTSWIVVRRHLPHEAWFVVHLISYLALVVSIPHQFSMSGLLASGPARGYWLAFLAATAFCVLNFRVLVPLLNNLDHRMFVVAVEQAGPDAVNIHLGGRRLVELGLLPGQFFNFRFLSRQLWWHGHPFSTSSGVVVHRDGQETLRITVRNLGPGTAELVMVRPGTRVLFAGPYGIFSDRSRTSEALIMMGSGVGIAPLRALLDRTTITPGRGLIVLRARTAGELYLVDEIRHICARRGMRLVTLVGHRGTNPRSGLSWSNAEYPHLRLNQLAGWAAAADVYICGPQGWTEQAAAEAAQCGVPQTQIHVERFEL